MKLSKGKNYPQLLDHSIKTTLLLCGGQLTSAGELDTKSPWFAGCYGLKRQKAQRSAELFNVLHPKPFVKVSGPLIRTPKPEATEPILEPSRPAASKRLSEAELRQKAAHNIARHNPHGMQDLFCN